MCPSCVQENKKDVSDQHYVSECPFPLFILSSRTLWVTPLVNKACLCRVTHTLFLSPPGLNLTSAVLLIIWKSSSAFVKLFIGYTWCAFWSSNQHEQDKIRIKGNMFLLFQYGKYGRWRIKFPIFPFFSCVPILEDSEYSQAHLRILQEFQNVPSPFLLSSSDSDEPGIHTFPLHFHCALVQTWAGLGHPAALQAPPGGLGWIRSS